MNSIAKPPTMVDENKAVAVRPTILPNSFGLVPATMAEAMELAKMMAGSTLVPKDLQRKPADCLMVIQQAVRWQMDPFAVAQECSVIQGKLMHSGKLVAAVVNARGNLAQRLSYEYKGQGPERTIIVRGQLRGESELRVIDVTLKKAKTTAKVWDTQPDQQLMYHGARVWARRHTPELMLGIYSGEEFDDEKSAIANGTSIYDPDEDYVGGTPEKETKPPEVTKFQRLELADQRWREKVENWMVEVDEIETDEVLDVWKSKHRIDIGSIPERHKDLQNAIRRKVRLKGEELVANQVVHEGDEPRPATMADFYDEDETPTISERAIAARENDR